MGCTNSFRLRDLVDLQRDRICAPHSGVRLALQACRARGRSRRRPPGGAAAANGRGRVRRRGAPGLTASTPNDAAREARASVQRDVDLERLDPERAFELRLVRQDLRERRLSLRRGRIEVVDVVRDAAGDAIDEHDISEAQLAGGGQTLAERAEGSLNERW